jgi:hypothetical protein
MKTKRSTAGDSTAPARRGLSARSVAHGFGQVVLEEGEAANNLMTHRAVVGGLALLLGAAGLVGCGASDIRVANDTSYALSEIEITTPSQTEPFGTLARGETSDYVSFGEAYPYAAARFVASGYRFEINPIDYAGEDELAPGSSPTTSPSPTSARAWPTSS